jgi:hypothetical protein
VTEATLRPRPSCDPSNTEVSGGPRSSPATKRPIDKPRTVMHSNEFEHTSPFSGALASAAKSLSAPHRSRTQSRTRGNRGHPSPTHEGCTPSNTGVSGGPRFSNGSRRDPSKEDLWKPIDVERWSQTLALSSPTMKRNRGSAFLSPAQRDSKPGGRELCQPTDASLAPTATKPIT